MCLVFNEIPWLIGHNHLTIKKHAQRVQFPAAAAAFLMEAKCKNAGVYEISAHVKDPQVVKIKPDPFTTARLIACFASAR